MISSLMCQRAVRGLKAAMAFTTDRRPDANVLINSLPAFVLNWFGKKKEKKVKFTFKGEELSIVFFFKKV